jgi:hypothetical protein
MLFRILTAKTPRTQNGISFRQILNTRSTETTQSCGPVVSSPNWDEWVTAFTHSHWARVRLSKADGSSEVKQKGHV